MAFESNNFNVVKKEKLSRGEFSVDCLIETEGASKILALSTQAGISSYETLNGVINFSGCVDVSVVYLKENGETDCAKACCPFTSKFEADCIKTGDKANLEVKVIETEVSSVSADGLKLVCHLEQNGQLISSQEIHSIKTEDPDVCFKSEDISVIKFVGESSEVVSVSSEIAPRGNVKKILLGESQVLVKNVESGANFVSVSGEVATRIVYLNDEDKFESIIANESFKEEVDLENASRESLVEAYATIKHDNVQISVSESEKGCMVNLNVPVAISVKAYEEVSATVIQDLYSTVSDVQVTTESFDMSKVCKSDMIEGKIDGSLTLDEEKPRIDKILFVGGNSVTVSNSYLSEGEVVVEGIARSYVIYLNDEDNSLNSVQIEVPFVISDKFNVENADGMLSAEAVVSDVDVVAKKGREIFYDAKIKIAINYCYNLVSGVISEAVALDAYPEKDYAMELIFGQAGKDVWDIAKEARVREELILAQNPDTVFPLTEDTGLVVFHQKIN